MSNIQTQHTYRVDLNQCPLSAGLERPLSHTDALADEFVICVRRGMTPANLTGMNVLGSITWGERMTLPLRGTVQGSSAVLTLPEEAYAVPGTFTLTIQLEDGDVRHTLVHLQGQIARTSSDTLIPSDDVLPTLPEFLQHMEDMDAATAAAQEAAADTRAAAADMARQSAAVLADLTSAMLQAGPAIVCEAGGSILHCSDAAVRPLCSAVTALELTQPGTGDPSPNNIRPLPGWDAVNLTRTGRNLVSHLDYAKQEGHKSTVIGGDVIDVTVPSQYDYGNIPVQLKAGVTYTLVIDWEVYGRDDASTGNTSASYYIGKAGTTSAYIRTRTNGVNRVVKQYTFEKDMTGRISWCPNNSSSLPACSRSRIMLLEGEYTADTAPAFEPCDKQTLTAALPETVYGGTLDWTTGLLTVTHFAQTYDGTEAWVDPGNGMTYTLPNSIPSEAMTDNEAFYHLCSHYKPVKYRAPDEQADMSCYTLNGHTLCIKDTSVGTLEGLKAYLAAQAAAGTPVTIVHPYKAAYRTTHQLDPQTLEMLKGYNAVWSDTGDTSVVYIADTKMYIDNAVAALAASCQHT